MRLEGTPRPAQPGRTHTLELLSRGQDLALVFDGADALVVPGRALPAGRVELGRLGVNATPLTAALARFTGPRLAPACSPRFQRVPPDAPNGPFRVVAILPSGRTGALEPLIVTGTTSKGDIVYVKYTDAGHIQLGYDHWGVGGSMSAPIAIDYRQPHEFEIGLASLYADRKDAAWLSLPSDVQQHSAAGHLVRIDGVPAWECESPAYPSRPEDIRVGENAIGASSCATHFTGEILEIGRTQALTAAVIGARAGLARVRICPV